MVKETNLRAGGAVAGVAVLGGAAAAIGFGFGLNQSNDAKLPPAPLTPDEQKQVEEERTREAIYNHGHGVFSVKRSEAPIGDLHDFFDKEMGLKVRCSSSVPGTDVLIVITEDSLKESHASDFKKTTKEHFR